MNLILLNLELNSNEHVQSNISDINRHFIEKHQDHQISLKSIYICSCKKSNLRQINPSQKSNDNESDENCFHTSWKSCQNHIINLIYQILSSINCLVCNKLIPNDKYQAHLRSFACPSALTFRSKHCQRGGKCD